MGGLYLVQVFTPPPLFFMFKNLPQEIDDWIYFQLIIFFLIGFMINVYHNGQATLVFNQEYHGINLDETQPDYLTEEQHLIKDFSETVKWKSQFAFYLTLILYWIVSPLANFYFAFFIFKKGTIWV